MENSDVNLVRMISEIKQKLEDIEVTSQKERQGIRDELKANRHLMSDLWMADSVQRMAKGAGHAISGATEKEEGVVEMEEGGSDKANMENKAEHDKDRRDLLDKLREAEEKNLDLEDRLTRAEEVHKTLEENIRISDNQVKQLEAELRSLKADSEALVSEDRKTFPVNNPNVEDNTSLASKEQNMEIGMVGPEVPIKTSNINKVFIWDLEGALIPYDCSVDSDKFAKRNGKDGHTLFQMSMELLSWCSTLANWHFFLLDLEEFDHTHIDDLAILGNEGWPEIIFDYKDPGYDCDEIRNAKLAAVNFNMEDGGKIQVNYQKSSELMKKLGSRLHRTKETFNNHRDDFGPLLVETYKEKARQPRDIMEKLEEYTDNWPSLAQKCLIIPESRSDCINILVTESNLEYALAKVLLFGLGPFFPAENVYSLIKIGKKACFDKIMNRFGRASTYLFISDTGNETEEGKKTDLQFCKIETHQDLINLSENLNL